MNTRLHNIWECMRTRCLNPNAKTYHRYGGRGIEVCDEWATSYEAFEAWALANGYQDNLTLDRKDNDGPYSPENCRWATQKQQSNNRRDNLRICYNGEIKTVSEFAEELGIPRHVLYQRLHRGWSIQMALATPVRPYTWRRKRVV